MATSFPFKIQIHNSTYSDFRQLVNRVESLLGVDEKIEYGNIAVCEKVLTHPSKYNIPLAICKNGKFYIFACRNKDELTAKLNPDLNAHDPNKKPRQTLRYVTYQKVKDIIIGN